MSSPQAYSQVEQAAKNSAGEVPVLLSASTSGTSTNTSTTVNNTTTKPRKRKATSAHAQSVESYNSRRKDAHARLDNLIQALDAAAQPPPTLVPPISLPPPSHLKTVARDIWPHITAAHTPCKPDGFDAEQQVLQDLQYQESRPLHTFRRPTDCGFIRCIPCLASHEKPSWHIWANKPGNTKAIRDHLLKFHNEEYTLKCKEQGFDLSTIDLGDELDGTPPPFTRDGLIKRILRWIAVDDQPLSVVDQPEFRALRNYDIPHRTKVAEEMHQAYLREKDSITKSMQNALGSISLTTDLWSDQLLRSFMAVTAHYIDQFGEPAEHLIAFRKIDGQHSGANIGQALFSVLEEVELVGKIGYITVDNASNNDTLMVELEKEFTARSLHSDAVENRICCFPHVINFAVRRVLERLPSSAKSYRGVLSELAVKPTANQSAYLDALASDVVSRTRTTVVASRSSGQRREDLARFTKEGNLAGRWKTLDGTVITVPEVELKPVTEYSLRHHEAAIPIVTHKQYEVLQGISTILTIAQRAESLLSAERTPTLSLALPVYDTVIDLWSECRTVFPELSSAIDAGIMKLEEYVHKSRRSPAHIFAMFVNPSLKFDWFNRHFHPSTADQAYKAVEEKLLEYAQDRHMSLFEPGSSSTGISMTRSAQAQAHGHSQLLDLGNRIQRADGTTQYTPTPTVPAVPTAAQKEIHDRAAVQIEMSGYISMGTVPMRDASTGGNIVSQWKALRHMFPLIHRLAMDILPVQASSVSSERVFSSSKLTCTQERSRMAVGTVESLQVLKHSLKRRRVQGVDTRTLDFMSKLEAFGDEIID
ncbi:AC9 transposase [Ceratobasidium sp. AG-Ba]|nr:AC9 transposase [Ceratobasidium sp. AG-Ba]